MTTDQPASKPRLWKRPWVGMRTVAGLLVVLAISALVVWKWHGRGPEASGPDDPRRTFPTPYRNVRPEIRYVGDAACSGCHSPQARTYRHHPMGRSFAPIAQAQVHDRYDPEAHNPFEKFGFEFRVVPRGQRVFHHETRRDGKGEVVTDTEAEVRYVMGSGTRGRSYLIDRGGWLFQSPISWYTQKERWDLSPGFRDKQHFERPIEPQCLFCHANDAQPVADSINRYRTPLFRGHAIGCERCHGPGELHVKRRRQHEEVAGLDDTIVHPGRLEPALREAICEQCHLQGEKRVLRRGRQPFDYRPGLPLRLFWSVFVRIPELADDHQAVGQVEQMHLSGCYRGSRGQLGCVSCHDPHALPPPETKEPYYRSRCLKCHTEHSCSLPRAERLTRNKGDACTACHMPRSSSSDIAHTAVTDHRIKRRPGESVRRAPPRALVPGESPLVHFHESQVDADDREVNRDLGLALIDLSREHGRSADPVVPLALSLLEGAVERAPDDVAAWEAQGYALWTERRGAEAMASFEAALTRAPERERSLSDAALLAERLKRPDQAINYWRRAIVLNPWSGLYRYHLATLLAEKRDWPGALAECRAILRFNPASKETRILLIRCLIGKQSKDQARKELATVLALEPRDADDIRRWFDRQMR